MVFDCIIPTYNNLSELQKCLQGLAKQSHKLFRAIVCIDGSTDGTREWLQEQHFPFELVVCEHSDKQNHGRNATRNLAIAHLRSEFLCFLDSDLVPDVHMLQEHALLLTARDVVSVGNVLYDTARTNTWSAYAQTRGKNKYKHGDSIPYFYLATGNCAHRGAVFVELGGQDPLIARYGGGDTEYALRLHQRFALPVLFNEASVARGSMLKSLDEALQQLEDFGRTNLHYLHHKHPAEDRIFSLHRMIGRGFSDRVFQLLLRMPLAGLMQWIAEHAPSSIASKVLNYCVLARMYRGWLQGKKEG